ncbi:uncharacterized protein BO97DRAFT_446509 [Aspergillus homomorphus CBS 101889]|uniref:Transcription factor domain-containing protein n=1 Tax=Aspergillus homomorphus (strain CBS 101889) TaxID=1450537 RepID=A0A395HM29_ASPHC|nr:hypothetical protein BO97DRAFT_446509 [Aspergillus homomorphus CBS 101889]RAL07918.1 hypothetical protein BO97DRAFT_446509 [Aspergillus homomorphus CBS 101889]
MPAPKLPFSRPQVPMHALRAIEPALHLPRSLDRRSGRSVRANSISPHYARLSRPHLPPRADRPPPVLPRVSPQRSPREDSGFFALTVAIAALVVATLLSKFHVYRSHDPPLRFCTRREMVRFCYEKNLALRTSYYFDEINFQKFATSFLLFAAFLQLGDHNRARMLDVESMQFARLLNLLSISAYEGLNCIETHLRKKGFWLIFYGFVHTQLQNMLGERLSYLDPVQLQTINPEDMMPFEVDDELIFENEVLMPTMPTPCLATALSSSPASFGLPSAALTRTKACQSRVHVFVPKTPVSG